MEADLFGRRSAKCPPTPPCDEPQTYTSLDEALDAQEAGVKVDDMELHRLALKGQGSLESEFCFGDESNLHTAFQNCPKNQGHKDFIPMDELHLDHLPEDIRQPSVFKLIQCQGVLTVKVRTFYTSVKRPETHQARGRRSGQRGTGFVLWAKPILFTVDGERCSSDQCPCTSSSTKVGLARKGRGDEGRVEEGYMLQVLTAAHIVFDQSEAKEVEVEFSYLDEDSGQKTVKTLKGPATHSVIGNDLTELVFYTRDRDLYTKMRSSLVEMLEVEIVRGQCPWLIIVSHPHYQEKHVTFGKFDDSFDLVRADPHSLDLGKKSIHYCTPTCPGSSGARISLPLRRLRHAIFAHSGVYNSKFNTSSPGYYMHYLGKWSNHRMDSKPAKAPPKGDWRSDTIQKLKSEDFLTGDQTSFTT